MITAQGKNRVAWMETRYQLLSILPSLSGSMLTCQQTASTKNRFERSLIARQMMKDQNPRAFSSAPYSIGMTGGGDMRLAMMSGSFSPCPVQMATIRLPAGSSWPEAI